MDKDGTTAITNITFNYDGTLLAYTLSFNGSDWQEFRIIDLISMEEYPERLKWCKFSNIAWRKDMNGFFYNRYPDQRSVHSNKKGYYNAVYWHNIGTNQEEDILIYEDKTEKELSFLPEVSDDNKYLILKVYNGTEPKSKLYYRL
ncbi:hypothetical protein KM914_20200 [Virgibacillus pantothenticus]|uniref:hypothetical protein n=1 Tax=Virgibacillus pantothenticus TaxID=1473 RepID=UPI001C238B8C|nr:hypothetical protein [Virgibacillus pantothenticus]MBU8568699.1 hypothetical protein [Virgibacillus pantothenticus]MBU8602698.1 hypothetical protein [Virgibacillus pantothenticus]MBU8636819.1 hypothetical protein [Virgibacillus pantothenticus]MBU8644540.1 hypothetical protein [Virgibacillus pantothenticus]MBU8648650.1 hypothetical protein [Virgibacillus pantothenticus]